MVYQQYKVYHLHELLEVINDIGRKTQVDKTTPSVLWSRGHSKVDYTLRPTLLRDVELGQLPGSNQNIQAAKRIIEEETRKEHYVAKNYHFFSKIPEDTLGWQEVMQHHGVKTRMLDWSESILHSLIFSLECFFDEEKKEERKQSSPNLWILQPIQWNYSVIERLLNSKKVIDLALGKLPIRTRTKVVDRLNYLKANYKDYFESKSIAHLNGLFNLSDLYREFYYMQNYDKKYLLEKGEVFYCLAYMLVSIYADSQIWDCKEVEPLAIVESYHSERIRSQKGVFTIFPHYEENTAFIKAKKIGLFLDAMENMRNNNKYLYNILLCNPDEIAFELMSTGINVTWLYPEMPVVANTIEKRKIYL